MGTNTDSVIGEVTDLLQDLIRNRCVNDGSPDSGQEWRSTELLQSYLEGGGLDLERYEAAPGRVSLIGRIEGKDPKAPALVLMGHTDVVPASPERWRHDPFGGELIDGEVWGRGAVDMLNLTASMAVATKRLARQGFCPKGTLIYLAVADEEAMSVYGADYLLAHRPEALKCDYVITESGGFVLPTPSGPKLPVTVGEKGTYWCTLRVKGTPGHASQPLRTDNALVKAAEVVRRIAEYRPETRIHETWRRFVESLELPGDLTRALLTADGFHELVESLPALGLARKAHACTHTTFAPTIVHGGTKTNVIPDAVDLTIDIRTLPRQTGEEVRGMLEEALGELTADIEIVHVDEDPSSESPIDTPLWDTLQRAASALYPGSTNVPFLTAGATDARFFRRLGATAYGFGLYSPRISYDEFQAMFHGDNERIDQESLRRSTELWEIVVRGLLGP